MSETGSAAGSKRQKYLCPSVAHAHLVAATAGLEALVGVVELLHAERALILVLRLLTLERDLVAMGCSC